MLFSLLAIVMVKWSRCPNYLVPCGLVSGWERGSVWSFCDLKEFIGWGHWVFVCTVFVQS